MNPFASLFIEAHDEGSIIKIRAMPSASRERIAGLVGDALKIAVTMAPEKGRANKRIIQVLAKALGASVHSILLVSGLSSRDKKMLVRGFATEELRRTLAAHMLG